MQVQRVKPIVHQVQQRTEEWYKLRLGKVTGSNAKKVHPAITDDAIAAAIRKVMDVPRLSPKIKLSQEYISLIKIAKLNPLNLFETAGMEIPESKERKTYRENLVGERLTGLQSDPEPYVNHDMKWGMVNEDLAVTLYQMEKLCIVEPGPFMDHPELMAGVSPDGLVTDTKTGEVGLVEVKCLRTANHLFKIIETQEVPEDFMDQIQMQLWISGRDWCDFVGFDSRLQEGLKFFTKRVEYDENYIHGTLEPDIRLFLEQCGKKEKYFRKLIREGKEKNESVGYNNAERIKADSPAEKNTESTNGNKQVL